ncbi:hypothetical protein LSAT2_025185 [Lamellibrachia satsuma]|nr:hypothetical protein LSAT2_025185 [Lamellibrachia satsuma]
MADNGFSATKRRVLKLTFDGLTMNPLAPSGPSVLQGLGHPTQIERLKSHSLESTGKLQITPEKGANAMILEVALGERNEEIM